jgi:hypothetical protein
LDPRLSAGRLGALSGLVVVANDLRAFFSGGYGAFQVDAMPTGTADIGAAAYVEADRMLGKPFALLLEWVRA